MEFVKEGKIIENKNTTISSAEKDLEEAFNADINFNDIVCFDVIDVTTQKVPLFITLIEKILKNTLVKHNGIIPQELAALYCSYVLMAIYKIDEITSKIIYFNKKSESEAEYIMASEKAKAVLTKDSEAARERWVQENSELYRQKKDYQYKTYAVLRYFEAKQKSLEKVYYLCKNFLSDTSTTF